MRIDTVITKHIRYSSVLIFSYTPNGHTVEPSINGCKGKAADKPVHIAYISNILTLLQNIRWGEKEALKKRS